MQLWDIGGKSYFDSNSYFSLFFTKLVFQGQERICNLTRVYYKDAVGCFIVLDITRDATFEGATHWKNDLDEKVRLPDDSPIPCVLLANKVNFL